MVASCDPALPAPGRSGLNRQAKTASVQDRSQAVQRWIAGPGEHSIEALPVQVGILRQGPDAAAGVGNIAKSQKEHTRVVVLQAGVEIPYRLVRILE
jgi:hypothetical protein